MTPRQPRKTVQAADANPALTPNTAPLQVGDGAGARRERPPRVPFGSYLPPDLQRQFKARCVLQGLEMQDALEQAIRQWLASSPVS